MRLRTLLATAVAGTLAVGLSGTAMADPVLTPAEAGTVVAWGNSDDPSAGPALDVPSDLTGAVVSTAATNQASAAVTADGHLRVWGASDAAEAHEAPTDVTDAVSVSLTSGSGAVLHADGTVTAWGASPALLDVPSGLRAKAISLSTATGYAVTTTGALVRWGDVNPDDGIPSPPQSGLTDLVDVSAGLFQVLALRADGTVVAWALPFLADLNSVPDLGGKEVTQIATGITTDGVVLEDGTIKVWGVGVPENEPEFDGQSAAGEVVSLDLYTDAGAVTADGAVHAWGSVPAVDDVPESLDGQPVSGITMGDQHALAVVTTFRDISKPAITGSAQIGGTLRATPATYSLTPDAPATGQWYADAAPVADRTGSTLTLDPTMLGQQISYRSTATRDGETITTSSDAVGPVARATSITRLTVAPATGRYGKARTATATVTKTGGVAAGTVTFKLGGTEKKASLAGGKATWTLPRTLAVGRRTMTASYPGDATTTSSRSAAATVSVTKAVSKVRAARPKVKGKTKRIAKRIAIVVTVRTVKGISPAGKVTVTLKGKTKKRVTVRVNGKGKAKITIKKVKRGKYKAQLRYTGNGKVAGARTTTRFKV